MNNKLHQRVPNHCCDILRWLGTQLRFFFFSRNINLFKSIKSHCIWKLEYRHFKIQIKSILSFAEYRPDFTTIYLGIHKTHQHEALEATVSRSSSYKLRSGSRGKWSNPLTIKITYELLVSKGAWLESSPGRNLYSRGIPHVLSGYNGPLFNCQAISSL